MPNIVVEPIPFEPGNVAVGTPYTPDDKTNYVTIPNVDIATNLMIPSEEFDAKYTTPNAGKTISHAMAVLADASVENVEGEAYLRFMFHTQVFFTDSTRDYNVVEASIHVKKPTDFNTFTVIGPLNPVIPEDGVTAVYDSTITDQIIFSITLDAFALPVMGAASVKVQVATGTFTF